MLERTGSARLLCRHKVARAEGSGLRAFWRLTERAWVCGEERNIMSRVLALVLAMAFVPCAAFGQKKAAKAESCERLARVALPNAKITLSQRVAAGDFTPMTPVTQWMGS